MASDYQFPQSLSLSNSSNVRDPSFSSYLNGADGRLEMKLAVLTQSGTSPEGQVSPDEEIEVFSADKYFNKEEDEKKPKESVKISARGLRRSAVLEGSVRSKISLGTPSIQSKSSSWHNQTALLHSFPSQLPGRPSTGEVRRKKSFLSRIICRCSCVSKRSLKVQCTEPTNLLLQTKAIPLRKPLMKDSKIFPPTAPSLLHKAIFSPVLSANPSPTLLKGVKEGSPYTTDSFDFPALGKVKKSIRLDRELNLLNWDELYPRSKDVNIASRSISVEYYTDAESDASSDLFEIASLTGHKKPSFSSQIPDSSVSGYATPTTCHAPSEASIDWSIVTASAVDFSLLSDCQESKPTKPVSDPVSEAHNWSWWNTENAGRSLMGCTNQKGMRVPKIEEVQNAKEHISCHQRIHMGKFAPLSRVQAQASSCPPTFKDLVERKI